MNALNWNITPKSGAGPLHLEMNRQTVRNIIGEPEDDRWFNENKIREYRSISSRKTDLILQYEGEILSGILFPFAKNDLSIFGKLLYKDDPGEIVRALMSRNGGFYTDYGDYSLFFNSLNMILHDFFSIEPFEKGASIWSDRAYAQTISIMKSDGPGRDVTETPIECRS